MSKWTHPHCVFNPRTIPCILENSCVYELFHQIASLIICFSYWSLPTGLNCFCIPTKYAARLSCSHCCRCTVHPSSPHSHYTGGFPVAWREFISCLLLFLVVGIWPPFLPNFVVSNCFSSHYLVSSLQLPCGLGRDEGRKPCVLRNTTQPGRTAS